MSEDTRITIPGVGKLAWREFPVQAGLQVVYIPMHAGGDETHPDCERGFVEAVSGDDAAWVRYWAKDDVNRLRTVSGGERTDLVALRAMKTHRPAKIHDALDQIRKEKESLWTV